MLKILHPGMVVHTFNLSTEAGLCVLGLTRLYRYTLSFFKKKESGILLYEFLNMNALQNDYYTGGKIYWSLYFILKLFLKYQPLV